MNENNQLPDLNNTEQAATTPVNTEQNAIAPTGEGALQYPISRPDIIFSYIMLLLGVLFPFWFVGYQSAAGKTIWLLLAIIAAGAYMLCSGRRLTAKTGVIALALAAFALHYSFVTDWFVNTMCGMALLLLLPIWLASFAKTELGGGYLFFDFLNSAVCRPFSNFGAAIKCGKQKGAGKVWLGLLIALPFVAIAISLLSSDTAFSAFLNEIVGDLDAFKIGVDIFRVGVGLLVGLFVFGACYGALCKRKFGITRQKADSARSAMKVLPYVTACVALSAIAAVYLLYIVSQSVYLFLAFRNMLPAGYGIAEYARSGFFEFCVLAGINLILVAAVKGLTASGKLLKGLMIGISAFSLLLCAAVTAKLLLYIEGYGLTMLRVCASFGTILQAVMLICLIVGIITGKRTAGAGLSVVAVLLLVFSFSNPQYQIARYNIAQYENGSHAELDTDYLVHSLNGRSYSITLPYLAEHSDEFPDYSIIFNYDDKPMSSERLDSLVGIDGIFTLSSDRVAARQAIETYLETMAKK